MFSIFKKKTVIPHVRLTGVIGSAGRFRQGMDLASQQELLKKDRKNEEGRRATRKQEEQVPSLYPLTPNRPARRKLLEVHHQIATFSRKHQRRVPV